MPGLKISTIVDSINNLGTDRILTYYTGNTKLRLTEITLPEGPIRFKRWNSTETENSASVGGISTNQLGTVSSVFSRRPNYPIQFDRLFSGGGNSRSALETVLAHTENFFICYPQKANPYNGKIESNLKHLMWCPDRSHDLGQMSTVNFTQVISEMEYELDFGNINIEQWMLGEEFETIDAKRTHTQMQIALIKIGNALNFKCWIASNDRSIQVGEQRISDLQGVLPSLESAQILYNSESKHFASLVDCIWFSQDLNHIPAMIEIEHSTGVTSGLTRMLKVKEAIPAVNMSFAIVAPNDLRNKVVSEANTQAFNSLNTKFMPYSTVRELYGLIQRYNLKNVVERTFIEPFLEKVVE